MSRGLSVPTFGFLCSICDKTFKKKKDLNNHNKAKHPTEINKNLRLHIDTSNSAIKFKFKSAFDESFLNRFSKLKYYLDKIFFNNLETYIPFKLNYLDGRILIPTNGCDLITTDNDYLGIRSSDIIIIKSVVKCYSKILKQSSGYSEKEVLINGKYIPDINLENPFKNILEIYTIELKKNMHRLGKNKIIHYKNVSAYNVFYIKLPKDILNYTLKYLEIIDYKSSLVASYPLMFHYFKSIEAGVAV